MNLFESLKSAIEEEMPLLSLGEADSQLSGGSDQVVPLPPSALAHAGTSILVTSIASQLCMSAVLIEKEKEWQALQAKAIQVFVVNVCYFCCIWKYVHTLCICIYVYIGYLLYLSNGETLPLS